MPLGCIICYDEIKENDAATLPCGHIFDRQCIKLWLGAEQDSRRRCPICRQHCGLEHIIFLFNVEKDCHCSHDHNIRIKNIEKLLVGMKTDMIQKKDESNEKKILELLVHQEQQYQNNVKTQSDYIISSIEAKYNALLTEAFSKRGPIILSLQKEIAQKTNEHQELILQKQQDESKLKTQSDYICSIETRYKELTRMSSEQVQTILSLQREIKISQCQFQADLEYKQQMFNNLATVYVILMTILFFV